MSVGILCWTELWDPRIRPHAMDWDETIHVPSRHPVAIVLEKRLDKWQYVGRRRRFGAQIWKSLNLCCPIRQLLDMCDHCTLKI